MRIDILTLFPEFFESPLTVSMMQRASERGLVETVIHNFREYAEDKHQQVDDYGYGGGAGMVLMPEPIAASLEAVKQMAGRGRTILLSPQGVLFDQEMAKQWSREDHLIMICGHYKGFDERIRSHCVDDEVSIGDYVMTGGEIPALVLIDAIVRLLPGVLGDMESAEGDSFYEGILDHPHYTRPVEWKGARVPDVLLSGHHENIRRWRRKEALRRTRERRPDLLERVHLSDEDKRLIDEIETESLTTIQGGSNE